MASIITLSIFIFICFGFGYALTLLWRKKQPWLDTILLSLCLGLAAIPLVILLLRVAHVPLDIRIVIALAAVGPVIGILKMRTMGQTSAQRGALLALVLVAAVVITSVMYAGATKYPYIEDDDPWQHAVGARYVALEKTTAQGEQTVSHYLEPYPPYYTALMGLLHQTSNDLEWVLKFFNALIIGMSVLCAFYAFEALTGDASTAAVGAVIIGFIPAYMSHFIWSQTLAIPVFLIAVWALAQLKDVESTKAGSLFALSTWKGLLRSGPFWIAVIAIWSSTIIQPSAAAVFALLFVIYAAVLLIGRAIQRRPAPWPSAIAVVAGGVLSAITWLGFIVVYGWSRVAEQIGVSASIFEQGGADTSGNVVYSVADIIFAPSSSKIDQATGIGWFLSVLVIVAVILLIINWKKLFSAKNEWGLVIIAWLVVCLVGIEGNALPFKLFPHRFWVFLAIPVALLSAETIMLVARGVPKPQTARRPLLNAAVVVIAAGIITAVAVLTSLGPRLAVQQAIWPPGMMWTSQQELQGYSSLPSLLPPQSRVLPLCSDDAKVIGFGMASEPWNPDLKLLRADLPRLVNASMASDAARTNTTNTNGTTIPIPALPANADPGQRIVAFMTQYHYEYLILDTTCVSDLGENETIALADSISRTNAFQQTSSQPGFLVVKLVR